MCARAVTIAAQHRVDRKPPPPCEESPSFLNVSPSASPSPVPLLPNELLSQIISLALYTPFESASRSKRAWKLIKGFTLASRRFRDISLRVWFARVKLLTYDDWAAYGKVPGTGLFYWMRDLHFLEPQMPKHLLVLPSFTHLQCVSYEPNGVDSGRWDTSRLQDVLTLLPPGVLEMTLAPVPAVSCDLIDRIAAKFKDLRSLSLGSKLVHEPLPLRYTRGRELAEEYAKSLQPLQCLRALHLGLHLIDSTRNSHLTHNPCNSFVLSPTAIAPLGNGRPSSTNEPPSWARECHECTADVLANEKEAVVYFARTIRTLRRVHWTRWNRFHRSTWKRLAEGAEEGDMWVHDP